LEILESDLPIKKSGREIISSVRRCAELFQGLDRCYGVHSNGRHKTVKSPPSIEIYDNHIHGDLSIGIVPINGDSNCYFAAIDIDIDDIDHMRLALEVRKQKLPLIVCSSKSGGAHLYTFTRKPLKANYIRIVMAKWASDLGHGAAEIFPKQDFLTITTIGNWINLPYFDAYNPDCKRCAYDEDGPMSFIQFLGEAERIATEVDIESIIDPKATEPNGMPPCLAHYYDSGTVEGCRNEVMYQFGVYARFSEQPDVMDFLMQINYRINSPPLSAGEIKMLAGAAKRKTNFYKCKIPTFRDYCNKTACASCDYGVGKGESRYDDHMIGCLTKHLTTPVRWILDINGSPVEFNTEEIMNYLKVRALTMERANIIAPPLKQEDWLMVLKDRLSNVKIVDAPEDASITGDISQLLLEFLQIANRTDSTKREDILRGIPVKSTIPLSDVKTPVILFRSSDLLAYLRRRRVSTNLTSNTLWMYLRDRGISHTKVKIAGAPTLLWFIITDETYTTFNVDPIAPELDI
jgi:hypothetical protein